MTDITPDPPPLTVPTTANVAALLRARTKDLDGQELGDFTDNTRPTGPEVDTIIAMAYDEVTGRAGANLRPRCAALAFMLVVIRAAMWVEGSYWPEQVRSDRSIFAELAEQYNNGLTTLDTCVAGNLPGDMDGDPTTDDMALGFGMVNVHGETSVRSPFGDPPVYPPPVDAY
jgi:hypothetical protein